MKLFADGWSEAFDGPGRRWVLYLYGCPWRCGWCANPQSFLAPAPGNPSVPLRDLSPEEVLEAACFRQPLFTGGGGVTLGGGEPTLQAEEALRALDLLSEAGIHTAVESNAGTATFPRFVERTDALICDLKSAVPETLLRCAGGDVGLVEENLALAAETQKDFRLRIPLVPGVNDSAEEAERIRDILANLLRIRGELDAEVLRLHHLGKPKYESLGHPYPMENVAPPSRAQAEAFAAYLAETGIQAHVVS